MSGDPWFRFFPSDWLAGVSSLTAGERGVYVTILAIMYDHGAPIPRDDARLARQCGLPKIGFARALDALISTGKILIEEDGCLSNSRVKNELSERESRTRAAATNANARWKKTKQNQSRDDANAHASALPAQCESDASHARSTTTTTDTTSVVSEKRAQQRASFDRFWRLWPNRVGRPAAEKAFAKHADEIEAILLGITAYTREKPTDRPWLNPATFLNQRRWEDKPASTGPPPTSSAVVPLFASGNPINGTPKTPSDFLRSAIAQRRGADDADGRDSELLVR